MDPLGIPEGADELPRGRDAMEFGGGGAGTINGRHGQFGRPGQGREHQCKTQRDDAGQGTATRPMEGHHERPPRPTLSGQDT